MVNVNVLKRWVRHAEMNGRVTVDGYGSGTLMYLGPTEKFRFEKRCGVYLDERRGRHNGTVGDKIYFVCPDGHGILTKLNKVTMGEAVVADSPAAAVQSPPAYAYASPHARSLSDGGSYASSSSTTTTPSSSTSYSTPLSGAISTRRTRRTAAVTPEHDYYADYINASTSRGSSPSMAPPQRQGMAENRKYAHIASKVNSSTPEGFRNAVQRSASNCAVDSPLGSGSGSGSGSGNDNYNARVQATTHSPYASSHYISPTRNVSGVTTTSTMGQTPQQNKSKKYAHVVSKIDNGTRDAGNTAAATPSAQRAAPQRTAGAFVGTPSAVATMATMTTPRAWENGGGVSSAQRAHSRGGSRGRPGSTSPTRGLGLSSSDALAAIAKLQTNHMGAIVKLKQSSLGEPMLSEMIVALTIAHTDAMVALQNRLLPNSPQREATSPEVFEAAMVAASERASPFDSPILHRVDEDGRNSAELEASFIAEADRVAEEEAAADAAAAAAAAATAGKQTPKKAAVRTTPERNGHWESPRAARKEMEGRQANTAPSGDALGGWSRVRPSMQKKAAKFATYQASQAKKGVDDERVAANASAALAGSMGTSDTEAAELASAVSRANQQRQGDKRARTPPAVVPRKKNAGTPNRSIATADAAVSPSPAPAPAPAPAPTPAPAPATPASTVMATPSPSPSPLPSPDKVIKKQVSREFSAGKVMAARKKCIASALNDWQEDHPDEDSATSADWLEEKKEALADFEAVLARKRAAAEGGDVSGSSSKKEKVPPPVKVRTGSIKVAVA